MVAVTAAGPQLRPRIDGPYPLTLRFAQSIRLGGGIVAFPTRATVFGAATQSVNRLMLIENGPNRSGLVVLGSDGDESAAPSDRF